MLIPDEKPNACMRDSSFGKGNQTGFLQDYPWCYFSALGRPNACSTSAVAQYQKRILSLSMEQSDIHTQVSRLEFQKLCKMRSA